MFRSVCVQLFKRTPTPTAIGPTDKMLRAPISVSPHATECGFEVFDQETKQLDCQIITRGSIEPDRAAPWIRPRVLSLERTPPYVRNTLRFRSTPKHNGHPIVEPQLGGLIYALALETSSNRLTRSEVLRPQSRIEAMNPRRKQHRDKFLRSKILICLDLNDVRVRSTPILVNRSEAAFGFGETVGPAFGR
jgi:hypothetical protein